MPIIKGSTVTCSHNRCFACIMVMVTHNSLFAEVADKVIYVKNGTVAEVKKNESPKDAFDLDW